jgi:hypothetical protein
MRRHSSTAPLPGTKLAIQTGLYMITQKPLNLTLLIQKLITIAVIANPA